MSTITLFEDASGADLDQRKLIYEDGTSEIVRVERVYTDSSGTPGTPLNAETLNSIVQFLLDADSAILTNLNQKITNLSNRITALENFKSSITSSGTSYKIYGAVAN